MPEKVLPPGEKTVENSAEGEDPDLVAYIENIRNRRMEAVRSGACDLYPQNPVSKQAFLRRVVFPDGVIRNRGYRIESDRPVIGSLLVKGRTLIHEEVCRYVDPVISSQESVNLNVVENFRMVMEMIERLEKRMDARDPGSGSAAKPVSTETASRAGTPALSWPGSAGTPVSSEAVDEPDLIGTIACHQPCTDLVRRIAEKNSAGRVPRILGIGPGQALLSVYLSRGSTCDIRGIDHDLKRVESCRKQNARLGGHVRFLVMDVFDPDLLKDGCFDVAFSVGFLPQFDNDAIIALVQQQLSVAKAVVLSVPSEHQRETTLPGERMRTPDDWKRILSDGNFSVESLAYYCNGKHIAAVIIGKS